MFLNIHGNTQFQRDARAAKRRFDRATGAEERKSAAQEKRDRRNAKRATRHPATDPVQSD